MTYWDLSHVLYPEMTGVPGLPGVTVEPIRQITEGAQLNVSLLTTTTHTGTHVDAPSHAYDGARTIDQLVVSDLVGTVVVVYTPAKPGTLIGVDDIEKAGPKIRKGDFLFYCTGWDQKFESAEYLDFPSLDPEVGEWAVEVGLRAVGGDTLSPDLPFARRPEDFDVPLHRTLLGSDVLIVENLRGLQAICGKRVNVVLGVVPIRGADGGPARVVAWDSGVPDQ